ncbi:hypothetical protein C8024_12375 [Sphingopyxis sp. BSNA05]|uniref:hypothetical protein n=1 Tax=Sphingopyxis sp. BSNA05 TaxID=1236614 RepID=UPI00156565A9|nr:hypothetical protein [Sphingopyxis sp. BSNA05]NRD90086.1 hypothetical protein [Sphingopyxis sp. BSNA05]
MKRRPLQKCLQESVERFPNDAHLLSVSAFARNMSERFTEGSAARGAGMLLARKAEALNQNSAGANFAVAQSAFLPVIARLVSPGAKKPSRWTR